MLLGNEQRKRGRRRGPDVHPGTYVLLGVAILFATFAIITVVHNGSKDQQVPLPAGAAPVPEQVAPGVAKGSAGAPSQKNFDPLAFDASNTSDLEKRAALGYAHPLYTLTEGGAAAG